MGSVAYNPTGDYNFLGPIGGITDTGMLASDVPPPGGSVSGGSGWLSSIGTILSDAGAAASNVIKALNAPPVPVFSGAYTPNQIYAQNAAAGQLGSSAPSTTSGIYKYLLIAGVVILAVALGAHFLKK